MRGGRHRNLIGGRHRSPAARRPLIGAPARMVASLLPHSTSGRTLAAGAAIDSLGSGMFLAAATLYFVGVVGLQALQVGAVLSIASVFGLLSPVPVARLADRIGATPVYLTLLALRGLGYAGYAAVDDFWSYAVLTCVLTALDRASSPLQQVVIGLIEGPENQTRTMASIGSVRNVGLTAGFALAGGILAVQNRIAFVALFLANAASIWVIALLVRRVYRKLPRTALDEGGHPAGRTPTGRAAPPAAAVRSPFRDLGFSLFTFWNGLLALHDSVLFVLLPIWVVTRTSAPASLVPVLLALNTGLTAVLQVNVARFAKGAARSLRLVLAALVPLLLCCAVFAGAEYVATVPALILAILAIALLTVGENMHAAGVWELSYELSPKPARSRYLAAFSLGLTGQQIIGPTLMTAVLLPLGGRGWVLLATLFLLAAVGIRAAVGRRVNGSRATSFLVTGKPSEVSP